MDGHFRASVDRATGDPGFSSLGRMCSGSGERQNQPHAWRALQVCTHGRSQLQVALGPFKFFITLKAHARDQDELPPFRIPVLGTIHQEIQAIPNAVLFGARIIGTTVTDTIILQSRVGEPFELCGFDRAPENIELAPLSSHSGIKHGFRISWTVSGPGEHSGTIRFQLENCSWARALRFLSTHRCLAF